MARTGAHLATCGDIGKSEVTALARLAEAIARREAEWAWDAIDPSMRATFTERLAEHLPEMDPAVEWENMPLRYRREWASNLTRTPDELRAVWEEDRRRLAEEADEATIEVFKVLIGAGR
jgi:hypothetical protein